jgi:hypothetical protein
MEKTQPAVYVAWKLYQQCFHCNNLRPQTALSICTSTAQESLEELSQQD